MINVFPSKLFGEYTDIVLDIIRDWYNGAGIVNYFRQLKLDVVSIKMNYNNIIN